MTSSQIECFLAAAEYSSFTKAARSLYMTTAAVSKNVLALESELELKLFWRGQNALTLTPSGSILLEHMKRSRLSFARALQEARAISKELSGVLSIGFLKGQMMDDEIRSILLGFEKAQPQVEMRVFWEDYHWLNEALSENRLDLVEIVESAVRRNPKAHCLTVTTLDTLLVMPKEHPLAGREDLSFKDLGDEPLILPSDPEGVYSEKRIRAAWAAAGFEPRLIFAPDLDTQIFWVELNKGLAIANANHVMANGSAVVCARLRELPPENLVLAWNESNGNPLLRVFLEECRRQGLNGK